MTEAKLIFNGTLPDNSTARPEGPHLYLHEGTYYLLIAEGVRHTIFLTDTIERLYILGGTDIYHRATVQRGPSPSGPWENNPSNPILYNGADLTLPVQATGHADFLEGDDGKWWGVALGVRPQNSNFSHQQLGMLFQIVPST